MTNSELDRLGNEQFVKDIVLKEKPEDPHTVFSLLNAVAFI